MKIRNPRLIAAAGWLGTRLVRMLSASLRFEYRSLGRFPVDPLQPPETGPFIYALWHENFLIPIVRFGNPGVAALVSRHADGELLGTLDSPDWNGDRARLDQSRRSRSGAGVAPRRRGDAAPGGHAGRPSRAAAGRAARGGLPRLADRDADRADRRGPSAAVAGRELGLASPYRGRSRESGACSASPSSFRPTSRSSRSGPAHRRGSKPSSIGSPPRPSTGPRPAGSRSPPALPPGRVVQHLPRVVETPGVASGDRG